jgi:hypothetical protein
MVRRYLVSVVRTRVSHLCIEGKQAELFDMLNRSCVEAERLTVLLPISSSNWTENDVTCLLT